MDTSADDAEAYDVNPGDYICADTYGYCTLRAAIEEANALDGPHTITFVQAMTIYINVTVGPLPSLIKQIKLDASGVWNSVGNAPGVTIQGGNGSFAGLMSNAAGCEIYGFYMTAFDGTAVYITSGNNIIGGTGPGQRNIISGNTTNGIMIESSGTDSNLLSSNGIGLTSFIFATPMETRKYRLRIECDRVALVVDSRDQVPPIGSQKGGEDNFLTASLFL